GRRPARHLRAAPPTARPRRPPRLRHARESRGRAGARPRVPGSDARRAGDTRRDGRGAVSRARRRAPGLGPLQPARLGAGGRNQGREVTPLVGLPHIATYFRPLWRRRHVPLGRPGDRRRRRGIDDARVRRLGEGSLAAPFRRRVRRARTVESPDMIDPDLAAVLVTFGLAALFALATLPGAVR